MTKRVLLGKSFYDMLLPQSPNSYITNFALVPKLQYERYSVSIIERIGSAVKFLLE